MVSALGAPAGSIRPLTRLLQITYAKSPALCNSASYRGGLILPFPAKGWVVILMSVGLLGLGNQEKESQGTVLAPLIPF